MPYKARQEINESDFYRAHASEQGYVRKMRERGMIIDIDNVAVDVRELIKRRFICNTLVCVKKSKRNDKSRYSGSCCTDLTVHIAPGEAERIRDLFELGAFLREEAPSRIRKVMDRVLEDNFTHENDEFELCLDDNPNNTCVLSYLNPGNGALYCAIDFLCEQLKMPVKDYKAIPCIDFPIHVCEYEPGRHLLTMMAPANYKFLGGSKEVVDLDCIRKPPADGPPAYQFLRQTIVNRFGEEFYKLLDREARKFLK